MADDTDGELLTSQRFSAHACTISVQAIGIIMCQMIGVLISYSTVDLVSFILQVQTLILKELSVGPDKNMQKNK